jgi:hypothetical protein
LQVCKKGTSKGRNKVETGEDVIHAKEVLKVLKTHSVGGGEESVGKILTAHTEGKVRGISDHWTGRRERGLCDHHEIIVLQSDSMDELIVFTTRFG